MSIRTTISGFPSMGENRELKRALESFWTKRSKLKALEKTAEELRKKHWKEQQLRGIELISSNDFSYYDRMLDTAIMINAIPGRFRTIKDPTEQYFAMARGNDSSVAMEMTKWFNTNYHYIVPELDQDINLKLNSQKIIREYKEALKIGIKTKINLIGPLTFLGLSKSLDGGDPFRFYNEVLSIYKELLADIAKIDNSIVVQIEEPILVKEWGSSYLSLVRKTYNELSLVSDKIKIVVSTYFEHSCEATEILVETGIWGVGLDFIYGPKNRKSLKLIKNKEKKLMAGVVDGRNIWINDYEETFKILNEISEVVNKGNIYISTSCSLLHVPYSLVNEPASDIRPWMAFAIEKLKEISYLGKCFFSETLSGVETNELEWNRNKIRLKSSSQLIVNPQVRKRLAGLTKKERDGDFKERIAIQSEKLGLPLFPTTTIGSFPQTPSIRNIRRDYKAGKVSTEDYTSTIKDYIDDCVSFQEEIGLDVLVHGEPERNDMVEYFGELMDGFHFTSNGWVQSYGSRCVKPPVIFGDVSRPEAMTVDWISYAQSKTDKIMKGMLTGPATIINWSFVRNDIPRAIIGKQIAVALSDEISDLQNAGIQIIQVDEAAFKEGYPLRSGNIELYERWTVESFKLAVSTAKKETQIHTHMCYSEFNDIIKTIEAMDADVITIETAGSGNKLLNIFDKVGYKNEIGPGVYDIHSPRVPSIDEFKEQINQRLENIESSKMWINPDCGLKTRKWEEVKPALINMVKAGKMMRE